MAVFETKCFKDSFICAGQLTLGHLCTTSPSFFITSVPHTGHCAGITKVFSSTVPPASFILAAATAAAGAIQIGLIASQDFAFGGMVDGTGNGTSDSVPAMLSRGEYVIPSQKVTDLGGQAGVEDLLHSATNSIAAGSGLNVTLNIDTLVGTDEFKQELFADLQKEAPRWQL